MMLVNFILLALGLILASPFLAIWWIAKGHPDKVLRGPVLQGWIRGPIDPLLPPREPILARCTPKYLRSSEVPDDLRRALGPRSIMHDPDEFPWAWARTNTQPIPTTPQDEYREFWKEPK